MNYTWDDDNLDRLLREAMQARPDPLPIQNLALWAMRRSGVSAAPRRWSENLGWCLRWQGLISVATVAIVGIFVWLAAARVVTQAGDDASTAAVTTSDRIDLLQEMASNEAVLISAGILLLVTATIAVHRALSKDGAALGAVGLADWI
jgi:hypothetical protein